MGRRLARIRLALFAAGLAFLLPFIVACAGEGSQGTASPAADEAPSGPALTATPFVLPTLLPTATRNAAPGATGTRPPAPTATPEATVDFEQPVVEFRYRIPALGLDRRLEGNVSGQITVVDETRGLAAIRQNQGGVLLELQELLPSLELEPLPEGCETCVAFSYQMPLEAVEGEGWLQDAVILASVENYTAALLGPHFPPGTQVGLRRSATAYDVAHTLALDADGQLYRWLATSPEVREPVDVNGVSPALPDLLEEVEPGALQSQYIVDCMSAPIETLFLPTGAVDASDEPEQSIRIVCPAFSLPPALLPLYLELDGLLEEVLAGSGLPRPPSEVALDAMLHYLRDDGAQLELTWDGQARITYAPVFTPTATVTATVTNTATITETGTLTATVGVTQVMSVTEALLESGAFEPGLQAFVAGDMDNVLLVRGEQGLVELAWPSGQPPQSLGAEIGWLDELLETE